jgi:hypothetical protein
LDPGNPKLGLDDPQKHAGFRTLIIPSNLQSLQYLPDIPSKLKLGLVNFLQTQRLSITLIIPSDLHPAQNSALNPSKLKHGRVFLQLHFFRLTSIIPPDLHFEQNRADDPSKFQRG